MSLSDNRPQTDGISRVRIPIRSRAVRLFDKMASKAVDNTVRFVVIFMIILTGIGNLTHLPLSPWWYILLFVEIGLDFYQTNFKKPLTFADPKAKPND